LLGKVDFFLFSANKFSSKKSKKICEMLQKQLEKVTALKNAIFFNAKKKFCRYLKHDIKKNVKI
jgi:hypothetical protein